MIYFFHDEAGHLFLLTAYAKAEREDLTPDDKKAWRKFVKAIKEAKP